MVTVAKSQTIKWMSPSPLWGERSAWMGLPGQIQMTRPVILRFANDMFMDEMIAMLTHAPWRLSEWIARPETWRTPMPTPKPVEITRPAVSLPGAYNQTRRLVQNYSRETRVTLIKSLVKTPATLPELPSYEAIKLYQPAHQRYYVVTGSLVREENGCPDYLPDLSTDERATFVVRALSKNGTGVSEEYGFVSTSTGMAWRKVGTHEDQSAAVSRVLPNEEKLPLFPVTYPDRCERFRQVLGGLIPVDKREQWLDAPAYTGGQEVEIASPVPENSGGVELYKEILYSDVIAPWKALIDQAETDKRKNNPSSNAFPNFDWQEDAAKLDQVRTIRTSRDEIQSSSWYVLLDFSRFLSDHLNDVWEKLKEIRGAGPFKSPGSTLSDAGNELVQRLSETKMDTRLFIDLAAENLAVGGYGTETASGIDSLWDRLLDFWKLEIYLILSGLLYASESHAQTLKEKVAAHAGFSLAFQQQCLAFIGSFLSGAHRSFLDFARSFASRYPSLKTAAVAGTLPPTVTDEGRLVDILKKFKLPLLQKTILQTLQTETSGAAEVEKSMWDLFSFYWRFESYVDQDAAAHSSGDVAAYLHSAAAPKVAAVNDQVLDWYYGDSQSGAWYPFLRFARDMEDACPRLHAAAMAEVFGTTYLPDSETQMIVKALQSAVISDAVQNELYYPNPEKRSMKIIRSLADALIEIFSWNEKLEQVDTPFDRTIRPDGDVDEISELWPDFIFPLTDPKLPDSKAGTRLCHTVPAMSAAKPQKMDWAEYLQDQLDRLAELVDGLVRIQKKLSGDGTSEVLNLEPLLDKKDARFVIRFVFERPHCGSLFQPLVSKPTCPLEMAPFFDPDAPARPVRIRMPLDISPAGLRKYKKNAMILFSDLMCGKIKKTKKMTLADLVLSVLPWPFHKDLPDIGNTGPCRRSDGQTMGMFCSLSIPIVTLCALVLLTIMVNLFNIFFKWIPWFFMCFPLPNFSGLKGKDQG